MQIWVLALNIMLSKSPSLLSFAPFSLSGCLKMFRLELSSFSKQRERERDVSDEGTMEFVSSSKWKSLQRDKDDAISLFNIDKGEKIRSLCFLFQKKQTNLPK